MQIRQVPKTNKFCTIFVQNRLFAYAKTKTQISCIVTVQLICVFVFAYAKSRFSHEAAHFRFDKEKGLCMKGDNQRFTTVRFDSLPSVKKFGMSFYFIN